MSALNERISSMEHDAERLKKTIAQVADRISNKDGNQNVTNIRLEGGRSLVFSLLIGLVGGVCLGCAVFSAVWVASMSMNQQLMNRWMAQEVTAVRSYITTGKLAPMNPPPVGNEEKK